MNSDQIQDENLDELQVREYDPTLFTKTNLIEIALLCVLVGEQDEGKDQARKGS